MTAPMPCGNVCGTCPLTSVCHAEDAAEFDPAEYAAMSQGYSPSDFETADALDRAHNEGERRNG